MSADELKQQGNEAFAKKDFDAAVASYSQAIALQKDSHVLYSNRAAAYLGQEKFAEAVQDADRSLQLLPSFTKAYFRKASALQGLGDVRGCYVTFVEAKKNCERTPLLDAQLLAAKKKWAEAMRTAPVMSTEDIVQRFSLFSDAREKLSTIAHFWNESSKEERRDIFIRFLTIVGGASGAGADMSDIQADNMIPMPMVNYVDLPSSRIASWMEFFIGLSSEGKTELLAEFWNLLTSLEQNAVVMDLKTFFANPR